MKLELNSSHTLTAELSVGSVLKNLASSESTGCLEVMGDEIEWSVSLQHGKLLEIGCSAQSLSQLIYRLRQLGCNEAAKSVKITGNNNPTPARSPLPLIQQELDRLVDREMLDPILAIQLSIAVTKEFLESLLWLQTGSCKWQERELNTKIIDRNIDTRLDLSKLIEYYQQRLKIWQNYTTIVQSPHQRPYLTQENLLEKPVVAGNLSSKALRQIAQLMRGISLRELSLLLKQDELKVIKLLIPYIREQIICLREPSSPFQQLPQIPEFNIVSNEVVSLNRTNSASGNVSKTYKIACIDDSPIVLDELERFLQKDGSYSLIKIQDPIEASSLIFRVKPDLILMDVTMPNINGYQLCYLFRDSTTFKHTPIIMVTGNKGLIDKARAKIVGATGYLTKPFTEAVLLELVKKYLV